MLLGYFPDILFKHFQRQAAYALQLIWTMNCVILLPDSQSKPKLSAYTVLSPQSLHSLLL